MLRHRVSLAPLDVVLVRERLRRVHGHVGNAVARGQMGVLRQLSRRLRRERVSRFVGRVALVVVDAVLVAGRRVGGI